jgi:transposase
MAMTIVGTRPVTGGVDTHRDTHVAAAVDCNGGLLGTAEFPANASGYGELTEWLSSHGQLALVGVEGTGSYGAGLSRHLRGAGVAVVEVDRPDRQARNRQGKSDPLDAVSAARAALSGKASGLPKSKDGAVEALRVILSCKSSATKSRTQALNQMRCLLVSGPDQLRERFAGLSTERLVAEAARLRRNGGDVVSRTTTAGLKHLARRVEALSEEKEHWENLMAELIAEINPRLLEVRGVGPDVAAILLVAAGDNPERMRSEAAFAALCGVAPVPASSGLVKRHRLNRGGNRQANRALHTVVVVRMAHDEATKAYIAKRLSEGKSKKEAMRCLKRYVAREIYHLVAT